MKAVIAIVLVLVVGYTAQAAWAVKSTAVTVQKAVDRLQVIESNLN